MPELRKDPVIGRWVIISTERGKRPTDFGMKKGEDRQGPCPFCTGNEHMTPPEIMAYRGQTKPNGPGWTLRVVPNQFPALRVEGNLDREGVGLYDRMNGIGAHEVIIDTPQHGIGLAQMETNQLADVLSAYRDRIVDLKKDIRLKYVLIFKNHGERAGATLEHSHSQLIALPIVPKSVAEELKGSKEYYGYKERCVFCDIIRQELRDQTRVVLENPDFVVITPFASRFPFELWILPKKHDPSFEDAQKHEFVFLAKIISEAIRRLNVALNHPAYNFYLHTSPFGDNENPYYHWHFEIMPRITRMAGFERGTGFYINPTPPEQAAAYLREVAASKAEKQEVQGEKQEKG